MAYGSDTYYGIQTAGAMMSGMTAAYNKNVERLANIKMYERREARYDQQLALQNRRQAVSTALAITQQAGDLSSQKASLFKAYHDLDPTPDNDGRRAQIQAQIGSIDNTINTLGQMASLPGITPEGFSFGNSAPTDLQAPQAPVSGAGTQVPDVSVPKTAKDFDSMSERLKFIGEPGQSKEPVMYAHRPPGAQPEVSQPDVAPLEQDAQEQISRAMLKNTPSIGGEPFKNAKGRWVQTFEGDDGNPYIRDIESGKVSPYGESHKSDLGYYSNDAFKDLEAEDPKGVGERRKAFQEDKAVTAIVGKFGGVLDDLAQRYEKDLKKSTQDRTIDLQAELEALAENVQEDIANNTGWDKSLHPEVADETAKMMISKVSGLDVDAEVQRDILKTLSPEVFHGEMPYDITPRKIDTILNTLIEDKGFFDVGRQNLTPDKKGELVQEATIQIVDDMIRTNNVDKWADNKARQALSVPRKQAEFMSLAKIDQKAFSQLSKGEQFRVAEAFYREHLFDHVQAEAGKRANSLYKVTDKKFVDLSETYIAEKFGMSPERQAEHQEQQRRANPFLKNEPTESDRRLIEHSKQGKITGFQSRKNPIMFRYNSE